MHEPVVLIADGDRTFRKAIADYLRTHEEVNVVECDDGAHVYERVRSGWLDLVMTDVELPDMNGRDLCRLLRRAGFMEPIILWSPNGSDAEIVLGLESGADDYLVEPFSEKILVARMRAHLRKREHDRDPVYGIGGFQFRPSAKELAQSHSRRKVHLTKKETQILMHLYRCSPRPVHREALLQEVWGYSSEATTQTLESHIYRLRQKIEDEPSDPRLIVTEPSGYRLVL